MVKYCGHYITAQEVPNEISLVLSITNCPRHCEGCHSPWLQQDIGDELSPEILRHLIKTYQDGITCVCFMGEGQDPEALNYLIAIVKTFGLKTCLYTGQDIIYSLSELRSYSLSDYIKTGSYKKELGGLNSPVTNQKMWELNGFANNGNPIYSDITSWFWRKKE